MTYDIFIVDGNAFDEDADNVKLTGVTELELAALAPVACRQGMDLVIRACNTEDDEL